MFRQVRMCLSHSLATIVCMALLSFSADAQKTAPSDDSAWKPVEGALGRAGKMQPDGSFKFSMPLNDTSVTVGGTSIKAGLALRSWAAFKGSAKGDGLYGQESVPIESCDSLPVVRVRIDGTDMRFLLDTAATTILNLRSFTRGRSKQIEISSWSGSAVTSAREVKVPELVIGSYRATNLLLPAVDLDAIGKNCGGKIDGILGIDLLRRTGASIDLQGYTARFGVSSNDAARQAEHRAAFDTCVGAFNRGDAEKLKTCFDPGIIFYTPWGEFVGRDAVVSYLQRRFLSLDPRPQVEFKIRSARLVGDTMWQAYDYSIESPAVHIKGRGMMLSHEAEGHWELLNVHNSIVVPDSSP
jgi:hypothetical protein